MAIIPKPKFNLKAPKSKGETLIFLVFRYRGKRVLYSTGLSISPTDWDFQLQRPIEQERRPDLWSIRRQINDISSYCKTIYIESNYGAISVASFKEKLDALVGRSDQEEEAKNLSFFEFVEEELKEMEATNMRYGSFKVYKLHAGILKKFAKANGKFDFDDVDWNFRLELIDWLTTQKFKLAYGNKTLSVLRQFMERARKKKLHSNTKYHGLGWKVAKKKATGQKVTLNPEELQKLADLELYGFEAKVRDLFLIGAGTGQRFSDYSQYTPEHFYRTFDGTPLLSIISQKTDIPAKIPLNIFLWLIPTLEKYEYRSPKMSMQKFNDRIKIICERAEIDEKILKVEQYIGRKARVETHYSPKHLEIASHTCRRSFATNLYRMGYNLGQIMPMTGHATEAQLREYIGIDAEENALAIARSIRKRNLNTSD
jgi:integrase